MNEKGKALTVFLVVLIILAVSVTAISIFFLLKEEEARVEAENKLAQLQETHAKVQFDLKEAQKQVFLLNEKVQDAEEEIENLTAELEVEQGLREESKKEIRELKQTLEKEIQAKEETRAQLQKELASAQEKVSGLQKQMETMTSQNQGLEVRRQELETQVNMLKKKMGEMGVSVEEDVSPDMTQTPGPEAKNVELEKIVVSPSAVEKKGKVNVVDRENNFVIVNLGLQDGVKEGTVLAIYRAETLLGEVRVTRAIPELSVADFIPPLTSQAVEKDDRVVIKK